jgi:hypothetical protein
MGPKQYRAKSIANGKDISKLLNRQQISLAEFPEPDLLAKGPIASFCVSKFS